MGAALSTEEDDAMQTANTNAATVTIKLLKDDITVTAARLEGGLALHKDVERPTYWTISHVPSGLVVWRQCARSKADAMVRFDAILSLTDWDRPRDELVEENGLHSRVMDLRENPPSAPRPERKPRPPLRVAKRVNVKGDEFEAPVWWEAGGLTVEGEPEKGLTIGHEPSGLRIVTLPRRATRAKAIRLAKTFLALGEAHGMDWAQRNPIPPTGVPYEIRSLVREAEQGIF